MSGESTEEGYAEVSNVEPGPGYNPPPMSMDAQARRSARKAEPTTHVIGVGDNYLGLGERTLCCAKREADLPPNEPTLVIDLSGRVTCDGDGLVIWAMPREEARDLLGYLRKNRPLGMPDSTFSGLIDALTTSPASTGGRS